MKSTQAGYVRYGTYKSKYGTRLCQGCSEQHISFNKWHEIIDNSAPTAFTNTALLFCSTCDDYLQKNLIGFPLEENDCVLKDREGSTIEPIKHLK